MAKAKSSTPSAGAVGTASNSTATSNPNSWFSTLNSYAKDFGETFFDNAARWRMFTDTDTGTTTETPATVVPVAASPAWLPYAAVGGLALVALMVLRK